MEVCGSYSQSYWPFLRFAYLIRVAICVVLNGYSKKRAFVHKMVNFVQKDIPECFNFLFENNVLEGYKTFVKIFVFRFGILKLFLKKLATNLIP